MRKRIKHIITGIVSIVIYLLFILIVWYFISSFLVDKDAVRKIVTNFGVIAPLIFILIQIIQNVVAPIAHYPVLLAGGLIFGPIWGFIYNWIGTVIGSILIILLTKKFGRPLVKRMVSQKFIDKYDYLISKLNPYVLFLVYFLPLFPDDEITYIVGLSSMPARHIFFAIILGKTGGASLSIIGDDPVNGLIPTLIVNTIILLFGTICYFWRDILEFVKNKIFRKKK
ncbi:MAG: VTT domain-containing protein [Candidatus Woesearchaeota archaeon]|jgi:uncharacterized membrane protein YdjX (TVP38/TMEM64 family)